MKKLIILALAVILAVPAAWAQETLKVGEVVVSALRADEEVEELPANVTVITQEDIQNSTSTNVQDLLRDEEGIFVRDLYGGGSKSTVDMRGFGRGINTAILIDGRKVNEIDLAGTDWNLIPLENVERIEIVRGGSSVLYGDNAMSGVVNIITKKGVTKKPEVEVGGRYESYNGNAEHLTLRGAADRVSYFLMGKRRETDGYRDNSHFGGWDVSGSLGIDLTDSLYLDLRGTYHTDEQGLAGSLTEAEMQANRRQTTTPDDRVENDQYNAGATLGYSPWDWGEFELGYSFNKRDFDSLVFFFGISFALVRETDTHDLKAKFTSRHDLFGHENLFVTGVDLRRSNVNNVSVSIFGTTFSEIEKEELGFYVQDKFAITDMLSVTAGYRYTDNEFNDVVTGSISGSGTQTIGESAVRAGVNFNYAEGSKLYASYSRDYRLPTTDEIFSFTGAIVDLRPEKSNTYETGIDHRFGKGLSAGLTFYLMDIRDELFFNQGTFANENAAKTRHKGIELGFKARPHDRVRVSGNWTYTKATFEAGPFDGSDIPLIPEHGVNLSTTVEPIDSLLLSLNGRWVGARYLENDLNNATAKLESYATLDAKLSYTYRMFTVFGGVNNIFDTEYSEYGVLGSVGQRVFYPAPKRNLYGGLKATF